MNGPGPPLASTDLNKGYKAASTDLSSTIGAYESDPNSSTLDNRGDDKNESWSCDRVLSGSKLASQVSKPVKAGEVAKADQVEEVCFGMVCLKCLLRNPYSCLND